MCLTDSARIQWGGAYSTLNKEGGEGRGGDGTER